MTTFDNLQELISLLDDADGICALTINGPDGALISIKRNAGRAASYAYTGGFEQGDQASSGLQATAVRLEENELNESVAADRSTQEITANRVGVFRAAKPAIEVEQAVTKGQIVGYIESMKLMNEVRAEFSGEVESAFAEDGMPVEYGQPLFRLIGINA